MPKFGDVTPLVTREEKIRLAGLPPEAEAFVVEVRRYFPGAELVNVRRSGLPVVEYEED